MKWIDELGIYIWEGEGRSCTDESQINIEIENSHDEIVFYEVETIRLYEKVRQDYEPKELDGQILPNSTKRTRIITGKGLYKYIKVKTSLPCKWSMHQNGNYYVADYETDILDDSIIDSKIIEDNKKHNLCIKSLSPTCEKCGAKLKICDRDGDGILECPYCNIEAMVVFS